MVLVIVVQCLVSFLVLQTSGWGREGWFLYNSFVFNVM